jgi:CHAT domain-containing protein/tetratricopeptide (TPR) repeat protein
LAHPCPDAETLAAFVDGRLAPADREPLARHLAACPVCYRVLVDVVQASSDDAAHEDPPGRARVLAWPGRSRVRFIAATGGLAAAAALALVLVRPAMLYGPGSSRPELAPLVSAAGSVRTTEARLTGGFRWAPLDSSTRSAAGRRVDSAALQIAAGQLQLSLERNRSAATLAAYGTARLLMADADAAISALQEATALAPGIPAYWSDLAVAYLDRAQTPGHELDLPQALEAVDTALSLDASLPESWFNKAVALERLHLRDEAREAWSRYLELERDASWRAEAERRLEALKAPVSSDPEDVQGLRENLFDELLPNWANAEDVSPAAGREALEAVRAAVIDLDRRSTDPIARDALAAVERALPVTAARAMAVKGHALFGRAQRAFGAGDHELASRSYLDAERWLEKIGSPVAFHARLNDALAAYRTQQFDHASTLLRELRPRVERQGYVSLLGRVDWMLGVLDALGGRRGDAEARYQSALAAFAAAGESDNAAMIHSQLATNFDNIGDPRRAWTHRLQALSGTTRPGVLLSAGLNTSRQGWPRAALSFSRAALGAARGSGSVPIIADALRVEAEIRSQLGDPRAVASLVSTARTLAAPDGDRAWARVRAEIALAEALAADATSATRGLEAADRAVAFFSEVRSTSRLPEIYHARARLAALSGDEVTAAADLREALRLLEQQRPHLATAIDQATFDDVYRRVANALVALPSGAVDHAALFSTVEAGRARDLLSAAERPAGLDQVQAALPAGVALVAYAVGDESSAVWIVSSEGSRFSRIPAGRRTLQTLVDAVLPPRWDVDAARTLSRLLLAPVEAAKSPIAELVIVPDGPLHAFPVALLTDPEGRWVLQTRTLVVAPSATAWLAATARLTSLAGAGGPRDVLAVGNPTLDPQRYPDLRDLPAALIEAGEAAAPYPGRRTILRATEATPDAVLTALRDADVVHFAGHALVNPIAPDQSFLALAGPGLARVTASDLRALRPLGSRLVVLAACETAGGTRTRFNGPLSLVRALLAAGVPSAIGNQWPASDRASRELFRTFHAEFARTGHAADALRRAQLTLALSADQTLAAPAQWAGFSVMGGSMAGPPLPVRTNRGD